MEQTAVEWLINEISTDRVGKAIIQTLYKEFQQAKETEKQQIMKAYYDGRNDESSSKARHNYNRNSEEYYKETFKNK